jgi:hypothetical protein
MVPGGKQATSLKEAQQCGVERQKVEGVAVAVTHAVVSLEHAINVFEEVNSTERMMDDKLRSFRDGEGNVTDQVRSARRGGPDKPRVARTAGPVRRTQSGHAIDPEALAEVQPLPEFCVALAVAHRPR